VKLTVLTFCFVLLPVLARGTTYYVAKTGRDSISCRQARSIDMPKLSIGSGLGCLTGGDTLVIGSGVYSEFINTGQIPNGLSWMGPTTVKAKTAGSVVLLPLGGGAGGDVLWISGQSYIILDGLVIDAKHVNVQGIRINSTRTIDSNHIRLFNLEVKNAPSSNCVGVKGTFIEIRASKFHHCGATKFHHGVYLQGSNNLVEGSEIYNNYGFGIHQYDRSGTSNNVVVRYNYIYNNGSVGILIGSGRTNVAYGNVVRNNGRLSHEGGIGIGYFSPYNNQVYDNIISANAGWCLRILPGSIHSRVADNKCWQNGRDTVTDSGNGSVVVSNRAVDPGLKTRIP
jgi:Right handed beta helix region